MKTAYKVFHLLTFLFAAFLSSCEKNTVEVVTNEEARGPYQSLADFYDQKEVEAQVFTVDPTQPISITGTAGTEILIPGNSLVDVAGQLPAGMVTISLKEIYSIKDMVLSHLPSTSNGNLLTWDGMLYIDFHSGPVHYKALLSSVIMPAPVIIPGMKIFFGAEDPDIGMNWIPADSTGNSVIGDSSGIYPTYTLSVDSLGGWINCARFAIGTLTDVSITTHVEAWRGETVDLAVYMLFPTVTSCTNVNNVTGPQTVIANNIPQGANARAAAIGVGRISKRSYFGMVSFTVTTGQPVTVTLIQADEEITTALEAL